MNSIISSKDINILPAYLQAMKRKYWITKTGRVILPLPAPIREELEDKGVEFKDNGTADYRISGKKVVIEFEQKED